jgi:hypothetical protein
MFFPYLLASLLCATRPARPPVPPLGPPKPYVGHLDESQSFDLVLGLTGGGGSDSRSPHRATHSLPHGDTRILVGVMAPLCRHCGFD